MTQEEVIECAGESFDVSIAQCVGGFLVMLPRVHEDDRIVTEMQVFTDADTMMRVVAQRLELIRDFRNRKEIDGIDRLSKHSSDSDTEI